MTATHLNAGVILRAPVSPRTWAEIGYMLASAPLAGLGFAYAPATLAAGAGLAITAAGFPLLALGLYGARRITAVHRRLAGALLGERIEPPAPPRATSGLRGVVFRHVATSAGHLCRRRGAAVPGPVGHAPGDDPRTHADAVAARAARARRAGARPGGDTGTGRRRRGGAASPNTGRTSR